MNCQLVGRTVIALCLANVSVLADEPNLKLDVSAGLIRELSRTPVADDTPVCAEMMGARISGVATTVGTATAKPMPSQGRAVVRLEFRGTSNSRTWVSRDPVVFSAFGTTSLYGCQDLIVDGLRVYACRPCTGGATNTRVGCISASELGLAEPLVVEIARGEIQRQQAKGNRHASARAAGMLADRMRKEVDPVVKKANADISRLLVDSLKEKGMQLKADWSSSVAALRLAARVGAGPDSSVEAKAPKDGLAVVVHQSAIHNLSGLLAGEKLPNTKSENELLKFISEEMAGNTKKGKLKGITFAESNPIQVSFDNQRVHVVIIGEKFHRGRDAIERKMHIEVAYEIGSSDQGVILQRVEGTPRVFAPEVDEKKRKYDQTELAIIRLAQRSLDTQLQATFVLNEELKVPPAIDTGGFFNVKSLTSANGWLSAQAEYVRGNSASKQSANVVSVR